VIKNVIDKQAERIAERSLTLIESNELFAGG